MALPPDDLRGWVPAGARVRDGRLQVELCRVGAHAFRESSFSDSLAVCMRRPFNSVFRHRADIETLADALRRNPGLSPSGFVFHGSRCGATLLGEWLAACPAHRVLSEPAPLDAALRGGGQDVDDVRRLRWLHAMVRLLAQPGRTQEQGLFIIFDSWHCWLLPFVCRAFPGVPWVFLVRDPAQVIASHMREPGAQMVPGMLDISPPGVECGSASQLPREEYCARMLGSYYAAVDEALAAGLGGGRVIDHADLPAALEQDLPSHFGLSPETTGHADMQTVLQRHDKDARPPSGQQHDHSCGTLSDAVRTVALTWACPAYRRLIARI